MDEKLKPCPFCGSKRVELKAAYTKIIKEEYEGKIYCVYCKNCLCNGSLYMATINIENAKQNAVKSWNRRRTVK